MHTRPGFLFKSGRPVLATSTGNPLVCWGRRGDRVGRSLGLGAVFAATLLVACTDPNQEPATASSADNPAYAVQHPEELAYYNQRLAAERSSVAQGFGKFKEFPPALGETDWRLVETLYEAADEEGRASAYAEAQHEAAVVQRFMAEEQTELVGRVASSVQYAAKEKNCDVQLAGPAQRGLERGVDKQLEERRRQTSQVQRQIDLHEKALGARVAERLREQVDQISFASYTVHVAIASDELRLRRLLDDSESVKRTLEDEKRRLSEAEPRDAKRQRAVDAALKQLEVETAKARDQVTETEERDRKLADDYRSAFDALLTEVRNRADKAPKAPAKS
jgi:hypothetical protein